MNTGVIYKITNKTTNKSYIGQALDYEKRMFRHKVETPTYDTHFARAIRKYGWNNFECCIVEEVSVNDLDNREVYWIKKLDTVKNGYNSTYGAKGGNTYIKRTDEQMIETKRKISIANSGSNNGNKGQYTGEKNSMYGKNHTKEAIEKIRKASTGRVQSEEDRTKKSLAHKGKKKNYCNPNKKLYIVKDNEYKPMKAKEIKELLDIENFIVLKNIIDNNTIINGYNIVEGVETIESRC